MKIFRLSWEEHTSPDDSRPITDPPVEPVLAWWESGQAGDGSHATMVAFVSAATEAEAWKAIGESWPDKPEMRRVVRFCNEVERVESNERFPINKPWSKKRIAKLEAAK